MGRMPVLRGKGLECGFSFLTLVIVSCSDITFWYHVG